MVTDMSVVHFDVRSAYSFVDIPSANGRMALHRTPKRPSSLATVRVRPTTPSFADAYATADG